MSLLDIKPEITKAGFRKYPRIPHVYEEPDILDNSVEVYEKIDGGNTQVRKIDGRVICGSRAHFLAREEFFSQPWFRSFQKWVLGNYSFYNLPENLIVYGEWSAPHTIAYKPEFRNRFFLIDVLDLNEDKFLPYGEGKNRLSNFGVEDLICLRTLFRGIINSKQLENMVYGSDYRKGNKEGLVIKDYDSQRFAKLWTSSVVKNKTVDSDDVDSVYLSLIDSDEKITERRLIEELEIELGRGMRNVKRERIADAVRTFLSKKRNN